MYKCKLSEPYSKPKVVVKKHENKTENAKTLAVLNLSFHTRTALIALKDPKSFTKLVFGIVMFCTSVKPSDGSMIGRLNTSSP